ncbi:hypothetical protein V501_03715 [Pseudogymnoascus sp. VKM F-4519 (FW-2642)]|nr:hypothetical protein V501_03715 [Pseudogymnoascus sp. VKM F-4519 (FW-2642)]
MVSSKAFLAFSLKCLASFVTIQLSSCSVAAAATVLPAGNLEGSADAAMRINKMTDKLGPQLAQGALVYLSGSDKFDILTERWQLFAPPTFIAVVVPRCERDVQLTIQLANWFGLPWLAISGHHGSINSLGTFKLGIQISMESFNDINLSADGRTARIGGGTLSKKITDTLWAKGKQTVTGACECTSLVGPMLGGGHGWLQGRNGLSADQLIEARVVLPNGQLVTVSEHSEYRDLFWALKGAGHNFGVVIEVKYKVYDVSNNGGRDWTYANLIFKQDKLEAVFGLVNKITNNGEGDVAYIDFVWFQRVAEIDAKLPVVSVYMLYQGTPQKAQNYIDMYKALGPANITIVKTDYTQISSLTGNGNDGIACVHGEYSALRFPTGFKTYNLTTNRKLFNKFADITSQQPAFANSFFLFEDYSTRGVSAVDADSTAFPDRFNHHLISPVIIYFDSSLNDQAVQAGQELRKIALEGKSGPLNAYVNYAHGDESEEDWYGHEKWRIQRLKSLKKKYDPDNKLVYYAPIKA